MKVNVQRRANSKMKWPLTWRDSGAEKVVKTKMRVRSVFWFQVPRLGTTQPNLLWLPPEKGSAEAPAFTRKAPPIAGPIGSFGIHSLVVCPVLAIQNQHTRKSTKDSKPPRNETDEGEGGGSRAGKASRACMFIKIDQRTSSPYGVIGVSWATPGFGRCSFLPSLILNHHLRYLNMSGASLFAGAHHFVASNSTFIESHTVSGCLLKVSVEQADGVESVAGHPQQLWQ